MHVMLQNLSLPCFSHLQTLHTDCLWCLNRRQVEKLARRRNTDPSFFFHSERKLKMQTCISLPLSLIHHQSSFSNSNLILSIRTHRELLPQPQSAHTDMLQDILQIPPAEPCLKSAHKQQNTGYCCCPH